MVVFNLVGKMMSANQHHSYFIGFSLWNLRVLNFNEAFANTNKCFALVKSEIKLIRTNTSKNDVFPNKNLVKIERNLVLICNPQLIRFRHQLL